MNGLSPIRWAAGRPFCGYPRPPPRAADPAGPPARPAPTAGGAWRAWAGSPAPPPDGALSRGGMLSLGGSTDLRFWAADGGGITGAGDWSGIAAREVPAVLRTFTYPPLDLALETD